MSGNNKVYVYLRVSTNEQEVENQEHGINKYIRDNEIVNVTYVRDVVSGKTNFKDRKLGKMIESFNEGDSLIVAELSRIGRDLYDIFSCISLLREKGVSVYLVKENITLDDSINSKIYAMAFGIAAEISRSLLSARIKESLERRKAEGKPQGRPKGSKGVRKLDAHMDRISELVEKGVSKASIAKIFDVSAPTVASFIEERIN
ncbi:MAG: resolvase [Gammaproteobacteria bacterium]|nr:MAG: resolvase [Gammaproteobacteria bacterium]